MKLILSSKVILGLIFIAQSIAIDFKDDEIVNFDNTEIYEDTSLDDLDKEIAFDDDESYKVDYFELEDDEEQAPIVNLRGGQPGNMTMAIGKRSFDRSSYPSEKGHGTRIVNDQCVKYIQFNVGPILGQSYYNGVIVKFLKNNPEKVEDGWKRNGQWHSVGGVTSYGTFTRWCPGYYKLPAPKPISCPPSSAVRKDDCITAGLAAGGKLRNNILVEGSWKHVPYGCSLQSGGDNAVHYNHQQGYNDGGYTSVCVERYIH